MKLITENQDCGCGAALAKDVIEASSNEMEYLHFFEMLDEHEYDEIKKSGSGSGKYGIIKGSANYEEFKKSVRDRIYILEMETGRTYESSFFEARTSEIAYVEWGKCMRNCKRVGLLLWIESESAHYISLGLRYIAAIDGKPINKFILQIEHSDGTLEKLPGQIKDKHEQSIKIKRKCGDLNGPSVTKVTGGGGGYLIDPIESKFYCGTPPPSPNEEPTSTFFILRHDSDLYKDKEIVIRIKGKERKYILKHKGDVISIPANGNDVIEVLEHPLNPEEESWEPSLIPARIQYKIADKIGQPGEFSVVKD